MLSIVAQATSALALSSPNVISPLIRPSLCAMFHPQYLYGVALDAIDYDVIRMHNHFPGAALATGTVKLGQLSKLARLLPHVPSKLFRCAWTIFPNVLDN